MKRLACVFFLFSFCLLVETGISPGQSYLNVVGNPSFGVNFPIENGYIDMSNGNLHMEFPLATHPQRGALSLNERLVYDSRIWMIGHYSNYYWWPNNIPNTPNTQGGWRFVTGAETGALSSTLISTADTTCSITRGNQTSTGYDDITQTTYSWSDPAGTTHVFDGIVRETVTNCPAGASSDTKYLTGAGYATDGSGYQIALDSNSNVIVRDNKGTEVYPQAIDRYGNYWSFDANGNLIDDTGRTPVIVTKNGNVTYYDVLAPNGPISNNGTRIRYTVTTSPISVQTQFNQSAVTEWTGTLDPITSIQLPDGSSYTFGYETKLSASDARPFYGELTSVTLPTGAVINYGWANYLDSYQNENRWLYSRTVGSDPSTIFTPTVLSQCASNGTGCKEQVKLHKPSGDEIVYELTLNNGAWNTGVKTYTGSATSGTLLASTTNTYDFSHTCATASVCTGAEYITKSIETTTLPVSGLESQTQYGFTNPALGQTNSVKEWDYFSIQSTTPNRETDYAYTGNDLQQVTVYNNGTQVGQTTYGYTYSATATTGIAQHLTLAAGGPYLQTISHWLNTGSPSVTTSSIYDTGQTKSVVDANSNPATTYSYQCAGSLPYQITNPLGQITQYGYDCNSGALESAQDQNDLNASRTGTVYSYEAVAGRTNTITYPDGGVTTYTYPSATETTASTLATPNTLISSQDYLDSMGRKYQHVQVGASTETTYDANGRVYCVTNPHSTATNGSTCITSYDGMDRPLIQQQPDGNTLSWSYTDNATTSKDESGNQWKRTSNAFGQLTQVVEVGAGYTTSYFYDGLANLKQISQLGNGATDPARVRSFTYDSMSRLICESHPEASSAQCPTQPTSSYTPGTIGFGYDANGNLLSKTDARGITLSYGYDALNRMIAKTGTGINYSYYYDSANIYAFTATNPIGRLVWSTNNVNASTFYSYDSMGRVIHQEGCTPANCSTGSNPVSAGYDLAGDMTSLTYPDGRVISQGFDAAAHLNSISYAGWNGTAQSIPYLNVASSIGYDAAGHLINATMGNGIGLAASYNNREEISSLAYGTSAQLLWGKQLAWTANGNLQTISDPLTSIQRQFGYDSLNRLISAQDIFATSTVSDTSPFPIGAGGVDGSSVTSDGATAVWTSPDDSNILINPDQPGAAGWGVVSGNVATGVPAPDGTTTAASFRATSNGGYIEATADQGSLFDGETITGSVWLQAPNGPVTVNLYLVEGGTAGYMIPASKTVTVTSTWQQFQLSGQFQYGHNDLILQIGGGSTVASGQTVSLWGARLEDSGTSGGDVTNYLPYSQEVNPATWALQAGTFANNSGTAPDGSNTAITVTSGSADSWLVDNIPNPAPYSGIPVTGSIWMRSPSGAQSLFLSLITSNSGTLGAKTVALTSAWQRFQVSGTTPSGLTELQLQIGGAKTFTTGQSIQVWGGQLELASTAGPYVPTGGSPVTIGTNLTNLLPYSEAPNGPSWGISGANGTVDVVTAPDGSMTGYQMTASSGVADAYATDDANNATLYDGATVTGSVFLRTPVSSTSSVYLYLVGQNAAGRTYFGNKLVQLNTSWQRFTISGTLPNGLTRLFLQIGGSDSFGAGQTIDLWGVQIELASTAGPYVMTTAQPIIEGKELTNILANSQMVSGPTWGVVNGSAVNNIAVAPDGTTTAATITATTSSPDTYATNGVPNPSLYDGETVTASVYLRVPSGTLNTDLFLINVGDNGWSISAQAAVTLTTAWQRFSVTGTNQNGLSQLSLEIGGAKTVTAGASFQVWGTQMVVGSSAAPYIIATSGTTNNATGQAAAVAPNGLNQSFAYDSSGNLQQNGSFTSTYTAQNQMFGYAYDAAGNLLSNGIVSMSWDADGRLASSGGATYVYNSNGERVEKQGVGVTDTVYFGGRPIARLSAGAWTDLIYGPNGLLAEVPGTQAATPNYRLLDHLGTQVGTVGSNGLLVNPMDHTPFGQAFSGATSDPYVYTGLEHDSESNLEHADNRQYASTSGRWMSPDPYDGSMDLNYPQTFNRYNYVGNNPLRYTDPSGLDGGALGTGGCWAAVGSGGLNAPADVACGIFLAIDGFILDDLFSKPSFHGSLKPRPNAQIWDEHHIHFGPDIAGALGLPSNGCEFGACGGGPTSFQSAAAAAPIPAAVCAVAEPCGAIAVGATVAVVGGIAAYENKEAIKGSWTALADSFLNNYNNLQNENNNRCAVVKQAAIASCSAQFVGRGLSESPVLTRACVRIQMTAQGCFNY